MRRCFALIGFITLIAATVSGQSILSKQIPDPPLAKDFKFGTFQVPHVSTAPNIDGELDDECWKTALHACGFFRWRSTEPIHEQTEAWMCADDKTLYIAFHCLDSHPELIKTSETQREGSVQKDDYIALQIDSQMSQTGVSEFDVSANGTQVTNLEAGSADNHRLAGDWKAAVKRTGDGWTAEIAIPFALLKYPKGADTFALVLLRALPRETQPEYWPQVPQEGFTNPMPYLGHFCGFHLPQFAPKATFLPYFLGSIGNPTFGKAGLDVKYPVSTGISGFLTLNPDFQTVEQAVSDTSFSYNQKYVPDHRNFFAEGANFTPDPYWFYSQNIPNVDEGVKIAGKEGATSLELLATNSSGNGNQRAGLFTADHSYGAFTSVGTTLIHNQVDGMPQNNVEEIRGQYGWESGGRVIKFVGNYAQATFANTSTDHNLFAQVFTNGGQGKVSGGAYYNEVGPNFVNTLGIGSDVDLKGGGLFLFFFDNFDHGTVENSFWNFNASSNNHETGGFFNDNVDINGGVNLRSGWTYNLDLNASKRDAFHDNTVDFTLGWNSKSLFNSGTLDLQHGHRESQEYEFLNFNQGVGITKAFTMNLGFNMSLVTQVQSTQTILTGTYRLDTDRSIGGRIIQQGGDVNAYLSYASRARDGHDFFVLLGDPNALRTQKQVTFKVAFPL